MEDCWTEAVAVADACAGAEACAGALNKIEPLTITALMSLNLVRVTVFSFIGGFSCRARR